MCEEGRVRHTFLGCLGGLSKIRVDRGTLALLNYKLPTYTQGIEAVSGPGERSEHIALFLDLGTSPFSEFPVKHVNITCAENGGLIQT